MRPLPILAFALAMTALGPSSQAFQLGADDFVLQWAEENSTSWSSGSTVVQRGSIDIPVRFQLSAPAAARGYWGFLVGQVFVDDQSTLSAAELAAVGSFTDPAVHKVEILQPTLPSQGGLPAPLRGWTDSESVSILPAAQFGATLAAVLAAAPIYDYAQPLMRPLSGDIEAGVDGLYHRFNGGTRCFYHPALTYVRTLCTAQSSGYVDTEHFSLSLLAETMMNAQSGGLVPDLSAIEDDTKVRLRLQMVLVRDGTFDSTYDSNNPYPAEGTDLEGTTAPPGLVEWHTASPAEPPSIVLSTHLDFELVLVGPALPKFQWQVPVPQPEDLVMDDTDNSVTFRMLGRDAQAAVRIRKPDGSFFWTVVNPDGPGRSRITLPPGTPPEQIWKIVEIGNSANTSVTLLPGEQVRIFTSDNFLP